MKLKTLSFLFFLIIFSISLNCKNEKKEKTFPSRYGGYANYNYDIHLASFSSLPGVPNCCPEFKSGNGFGYTAGFLYEFPFSFLFSLQMGFDFSYHSRAFETLEKVNFGINGEKTPGEIKHELVASLGTIGLSPQLTITPFENFSILIGGDLGYFIYKKYSQKESIIKPEEGVVFVENNSDVRNENSGSLKNAYLINSVLSGGIRYEIPINRKGTTILAPEIKYDLGINPIIEDIDWNINSVSLGFALIFAPYKVIRYEKTPVPIPHKILIAENMIEITGTANDIIYSSFEFKKEKKEAVDAGLTAVVDAVGINEKGMEFSNPTLDIEEFLSTNMRSLLSYVFFEYNSAEIPLRYKKLNKSEVENFDLQMFTNLSTLPTYYHILNIIGYRMNTYRDSKIRLVGCNSNNGEERNNLKLSKERANSIANYLINNWEIAPGRIIITEQNLPDSPTHYENEDGYEENRRVEIYSDLWDILKPIVINDTLYLSSQTKIKFYPKAYAMNGLKSYELNIFESEITLTAFSENMPEIPDAIEWQMKNQIENISKLEAPINYILKVEDEFNNQTSSEIGTIPVTTISIDEKQTKKLGDKRIDRYNLILFPFGSAELTNANLRIADFIRDRIEENSEVLITGYTDKLGEEEVNLKLSVDRANKLAKVLLPEAYIRGLGESAFLYDNDLPEGRFYNRTLEVKVQTPIKW